MYHKFPDFLILVFHCVDVPKSYGRCFFYEQDVEGTSSPFPGEKSDTEQASKHSPVQGTGALMQDPESQ